MLSELFSFRIRRRNPKPELVEICTQTVRDLQDREDLILVDTDYEVEEIKRYLGNFPELDEFGAFLVKVEDGEYKEIYGIPGSVAYLDKPACRLQVRFGNKTIVG